MREGFERAVADPSSDAYTMIEMMCLNQLVEAEMKAREMDAVEVFRARNQGKQLALKAAHLEKQNKLGEARAQKLGLEIQMLEDKIAAIGEKVRQAGEGKQGGRPFDYERALRQISAVIGVGGPEEFVHDKQAC